MGLLLQDDDWRIPDHVWAQMEPLLPERPRHPLGCHNPRVPDRDAMNAILLVLRTGMQWNALSATGICSCSSAYRRFREWAEAGVFLEFWRRGLLAYDDQAGIEWEWLALDGALGKAPLGGERTVPNPTDRAKRGETEPPHRGQGHPARHRTGRREPERLQARPRHAGVDPDRAPSADPGVAAGALPGQRLRLPRGVRARGPVRVHLPHPRSRRGSQGTHTRSRLPRPSLGSSSAPTPGSNRFRRILVR